MTYAITEEKHRILALWISNGLFAVLLIVIVLYDFIGPSPARTANFVANKLIYLSSEAGASPANEPVYDVNGVREHFDSGNVQTATCYSMVGSSVWLYFHFGSGDPGFAPFDDFHYQRGFAEQLPSHCPLAPAAVSSSPSSSSSLQAALVSQSSPPTCFATSLRMQSSTC